MVNEITDAGKARADMRERIKAVEVRERGNHELLLEIKKDVREILKRERGK